MQPLTTEWVAKAEGDFASATRELRARKAPNYDAACFHAQQCAEKYLKARLQEANTPFPRTQDLEALLDLLLPIEPGWNALRPAAQLLTSLAVDVRYPGYTADKGRASDALRACRSVRDAAQRGLG
ncbi:MAG TPA: HEPN domain-containing protein [Roseiflexaceae bacterium]|jgi:HEPN domain-containing protein